MGQSSSTQRDPPHTRYPTHISPSEERGPNLRNEDMNHRQAVEQSREGVYSPGDVDTQGGNENMAPDQSNGRPDLWRRYMRLSRPMRRTDESDNEYEVPSRGMRSAAYARMSARRSRLGSRFLPNSVIRGLLNSQEETPAEGHAHRHGLADGPALRPDISHTTGQFSPFGPRGITRRRSTQSPYSVPPRAEFTGAPDGPTSSPYLDSTNQLPEPTRASWRRSVRLNRMRHSISSPISHMFGHPHSGLPSHEGAPRLDMSPEERFETAMDTRMNFTEPIHELDSAEPSIQAGDSLPSVAPAQPNPHLMRRLPGIVRARSSRVIRREEQTPLSRVLQLAAAAIAAQLSGTAGPSLPNIQALGNDGVDGSLENFIHSLQHATSGQTQPPAPGEGSSNTTTEAPAQPVNFLRVFRFANSEAPAGSGLPGQNTNDAHENRTSGDAMDIDEPGEIEGRTVTLVVVGVRSVPAGNRGNSEQPAGPGPGLDALLGLPFLPPNAVQRPPESPVDPAQPSDGQSMHNPRHPDPVGSHVPPSTSEFVRPPLPGASRRLSEPPPPALFESPPGPSPPPSTPAEPGLSAVPSGTTTPSRRPSSASAIAPDLPPHLHDHPIPPVMEPTREPPTFNAFHQRRRSDSEFARHRALGSGSVRRNGMVEPDQPPPSGGRSWLIYVVGTNLSENHPALTTPSLFTDVRTPILLSRRHG